MGNEEMRECRAKIRSYTDKTTGEEKNVYATIGKAWVTPHASKIRVVLDTVPVNWDGVFFLNKPYEPKAERPQKDIVAEVTDEPISLDGIPF